MGWEAAYMTVRRMRIARSVNSVLHLEAVKINHPEATSIMTARIQTPVLREHVMGLVPAVQRHLEPTAGSVRHAMEWETASMMKLKIQIAPSVSSAQQSVAVPTSQQAAM
jgi:hypothetical protein